MTPAGTRTRLWTALAAAALALACGAAPALAREHPEPRSVPAEGPGSPLREGNRVLAEVRFDHGALAAVDSLRAAGARVLDASRRFQTVTVAVRPGRLRALGGVEGVEGATPVPTPVTYGTCGSVDSEGDTQLAAAEARTDFGVDGGGVTVGILSDSFNTDSGAATHAAGDVETGDLPGSGNPCGFTAPVSICKECDFFSSEAEDEGRGMAQVVHDLAPGAKISFATAFAGETAFAENIRRLAAEGASVIVDDVGYFEEPFFQDGPVAAAIDEVVAKGVTYFSAAGNDNLFEEEPLGSGKFNGNEIASWETPSFRDAASCPPLLEAATPLPTDHCLDFDPSGGEDPTFGIRVKKKKRCSSTCSGPNRGSGSKPTSMPICSTKPANRCSKARNWSAAPATTSLSRGRPPAKHRKNSLDRASGRPRSSPGKTTKARKPKCSWRSIAASAPAIQMPTVRSNRGSSWRCSRTGAG